MSGVNQQARAYAAWNILTTKARDRDNPTITYERLGEAIAIHHRVVTHVLTLIQDYCLSQKLPPLTILVVGKHSHEPGTGFIAYDLKLLDEGISEVQDFKWDTLPNPWQYAADGELSEIDLVNDLLRNPAQSKEVYTRVKVRGTQQLLFRSALLTAYGGQCALSGIRLEVALDAAHIIPWSGCTPELRLDPRNGILMLCCFHRLFDKGDLTVGEDYRIKFRSQRVAKSLSNSELSVFSQLEGKLLRLPKKKLLWPSKELLEQRNSKFMCSSEEI